MVRPPWSTRPFQFVHPLWMLTDFAERLRGTHARLNAMLSAVSADQLYVQPIDAWSLAQHAGHLADIEGLWQQRLEDLQTARPTFTPVNSAELQTLVTRHQTRSLADILDEFALCRAAFVHALVTADEDLQQRSAYHERLRCPMRLVDCAQFVAEHDDYHLIRMRELLPDNLVARGM